MENSYIDENTGEGPAIDLGSAGEGELQADLMSLDQYLVENPDATYIVTAKDDSLAEEGILAGDMAIIERGRAPRAGDIVLAGFNEEYALMVYDKAVIKRMRAETGSGSFKVEAVAVGLVRKYAK